MTRRRWHRCFVAEDEAIAAQDVQRLFDSHLTVGGLLRSDFLAGAEQAAQPFGRAEMHAHALVILQPAACAWPDLEPAVEPLRAPGERFVADYVTALDRRRFRTCEIQRDALTRPGGFNRLVMDMQAADAEDLLARETAHPLANLDLAARRRTGHDEAMTLEEEDPIDRKAEVAAGAWLLGVSQRRGDQRRSTRVIAGDERKRAMGRTRAGYRRLDADLVFRPGSPRLQYRFRDDEDRPFQAEEVGMSRCSSVCGITPSSAATVKQRQVDAMCADRHVRMAFVARDVDNAPARVPSGRSSAQSPGRRDAALLFFLEAVGISPVSA